MFHPGGGERKGFRIAGDDLAGRRRLFEIALIINVIAGACDVCRGFPTRARQLTLAGSANG